MNNKIIAIVIVCLFLLTGLTTVSVAEKTVSDKKIETSDVGTSDGYLSVWVLGKLYGPIEMPIGDATVTALNLETSETFNIPNILAGAYESDIPIGNYSVTVEHYDYATQTKNVQVDAGVITRLNFTLHWKSRSVNPLPIPQKICGYVYDKDNTAVGISGAHVTIRKILGASAITNQDGFYGIVSYYLRYSCIAMVWAKGYRPTIVKVYIEPKEQGYTEIDFYLKHW